MTTDILGITHKDLVAAIGKRLTRALAQRLRVHRTADRGDRVGMTPWTNRTAEAHGLRIEIHGRPYATIATIVTVRREGDRLLGSWSVIAGPSGSAEVATVEDLANLVVASVTAHEDDWRRYTAER